MPGVTYQVSCVVWQVGVLYYSFIASIQSLCIRANGAISFTGSNKGDQDPSADSSLQLDSVFVLYDCDVLERRAKIISLLPHLLLSTGAVEN